MRYIDHKTYSPNRNWKARRDSRFRTLLSKITHQQKQNYLAGQSDFWGELKGDLELNFGYRCWYTEANESVSDYQVDHFRPKGRVEKTICSFSFTEQTRAFGVDNYWWLAFEYSNYRISGGVPNGTYKRCFFPLQAGSFVAKRRSHPYKTEKPFLLDPTIKTDTELLSHDPSGKIGPTKDEMLFPLEYLRAKISIELYGLNDDRLKRKRQTLWSELSEIIGYANDCHIIMMNIAPKTDSRYIDAADNFEKFCKTIRNYFGETKEFLTCAKACLLSYGYVWIKPEIFDKLSIML